MKLGIAIPLTADKEYTQFWDSFTLLQKPDYIYIRPPFRGHIDDIRNAMVMQGLKQECTHLLMLDTDQIYYNRDMINILLNDIAERDVVGTVVHRGYKPFDPLVFRFGDKGLIKVPDDEVYSGDIIEVDAIGCGCVMYDTKVFKEINFPWFDDIARKAGVAGGNNPPGEDINFSYKLRNKGFKIHVNTSIKIDHIFLGVANRAWYLLHKKITEAIKENEL